MKRANSSGKDERSEFLAGEEQNKGSYQSGQMGQTVNLLAYAFGGSNPSLPTYSHAENRGSSSVDRALAFQAGGRGFEPRLPLKLTKHKSVAVIAQW